MPNNKPTEEEIASQAFEWATDYTPFENDLPYHKYAEYGFEQGAKWAREQSPIWISREIEMPPPDTRILVFSPEYSEDNQMRFRICDSQFFRISSDATHWALLEGPHI